MSRLALIGAVRCRGHPTLMPPPATLAPDAPFDAVDPHVAP